MTFESLTGEVFFSLCKSIDTPVSLGCWLRWKYNQVDLAEKRVHPKQYNTLDAFLPDFVVTSYLKKYEGLETGIDREEAALRSFAEAEAQCRATNEVYRDPTLRGLSPRVHGILHAMKRKIAAVLGPLHVGKVMSGCKWGPGATASITRRRAHLDVKISEAPMTVTSAALKYIRAWLEVDYHWFESISGVFPSGPYSVVDDLVFRVVPGDIVTTVPKDATIFRTIGKAPTANTFLQQGPGRYIRKRLLRVSVDLDDQSVNATWASLAKELDLCTLDLKSASDTQAKEVIKHLLPLDWWLLLSDLRSPFFSVDNGETWTYAEKFSAMGTAFTFELESLIFWAAVQAATEIADPGGVVSIYGDDIICTSRACPLVIEILEALGFTINISKSHVSGEYYESCGKHYWGGDIVTPIYQKEVLSQGSLLSLIRAHNRLYRGADRFCFTRIAPALDRAASVLKRHLLSLDINAFIPDWEQSDDGLLTSLWELVVDRGHFLCENHGIYCTVLSEGLRRRFGRGLPLLAHALRLNRARDSKPLLSEKEDSSLSPQFLIDATADLRVGARWISIPPSVL